MPKNKFDATDRSSRLTINLPKQLKKDVVKRARKQGKTATAVFVDLLTAGLDFSLKKESRDADFN